MVIYSRNTNLAVIFFWGWFEFDFCGCTTVMASFVTRTGRVVSFPSKVPKKRTKTQVRRLMEKRGMHPKMIAAALDKMN